MVDIYDKRSSNDCAQKTSKMLMISVDLASLKLVLEMIVIHWEGNILENSIVSIDSL
jgi:hypothetical protein